MGQVKPDVEGVAQETGSKHPGGGVEDLHAAAVDRTTAPPEATLLISAMNRSFTVTSGDPVRP
jgi:hypothetical protein